MARSGHEVAREFDYLGNVRAFMRAKPASLILSEDGCALKCSGIGQESIHGQLVTLGFWFLSFAVL